MSLGKFEAEPDYTEHYWRVGLAGMADLDGGSWVAFDIRGTDVFEYPDLRPYLGEFLVLSEDEQGFVGTMIVNGATVQGMLEGTGECYGD